MALPVVEGLEMPSEPKALPGAEENPAPAETAGKTQPVAAKVNILLVDDRPDKLLALESVLAELDENVVTVRSGREALRMLLHEDFAVILLDINMPGMDGFETAALIRQRPRSEHTPIIFVTGISDTETHMSRGYSLGAVDYILTPVMPDVLRTKVSVFVELHKSAQQIRRQAESLQHARDELESRVEQRTAELAAANDSLRREITERKKVEAKIKQALQEKEVLLKEVHHRVKNNLQVISSLLNLQAGEITDDKTASIFQESQERVRTMALIHEQLYRAGNLAEVDFAEYVRELVRHVAKSHSATETRIKLLAEVSNVFLPVDAAIPCGLIINEFISNALKHAFPDGRHGKVRVHTGVHEGRARLSVKDDGVGFPQGVNFRQSRSLGLQLVCNLTNQIEGKIEMKNDAGTEFTVDLPLKPVKSRIEHV